MKLRVAIYRTEHDDGLWGFVVTDDHGRAIVRSAAVSLTELGMKWDILTAALHTLLDVHVVETPHNGLVRDDERWDVAVRLVAGRDELPFRVS